MSVTEDQKKKLVAELRPLLPELFFEEPEARAVLEDACRARGRQSDWRTPASFWESELRELAQGAVRDGIAALIAAAAAIYPGNDQLSAMLSEVNAADGQAPGRQPPDEEADEPTDAAKPDLPAPQVVEPQFHTLTLIGSERHDDFLRLVRQLVYADAEPCYATTAQSGQLPQSAVLIDDSGPRAAQLEEQLLAEVRDWGEAVAVEYQSSEVRPYLLRQIVVSGTDNRRFALRNVPSTTTLSEIARAVLQNYTDDSTRARRGRVRTAIDRIGADGRADRVRSQPHAQRRGRAGRRRAAAGHRGDCRGRHRAVAAERAAGPRADPPIRQGPPGVRHRRDRRRQPADAVHGRVPRTGLRAPVRSGNVAAEPAATVRASGDDHPAGHLPGGSADRRVRERDLPPQRAGGAGRHRAQGVRLPGRADRLVPAGHGLRPALPDARGHGGLPAVRDAGDPGATAAKAT